MTIKEALEKANKQIVQKINKALDDEVAEAVKQEEVETISEVVYGVYTPKIYRRRGDLGGMADIYNIDHTVHNGTLKVVNNTDPNPGGTMNNDAVTVGKYLDQLIEYGHGGSGGFYDFPKRGAAFMKPRPFTKETIKHLAQNKAHVDALRNGLKRRGLKVK